MSYPPAKTLLTEKRLLGPGMMPLILPSGPMQVHPTSSMPPALALQRSMMPAFQLSSGWPMGFRLLFNVDLLGV